MNEIFKILGCVFVVFSTMLLGIEYNKNLHKRVNGIDKIIEILSVMNIKINYEYSPIPIVLKEIHKTEKENIFLSECISCIDSGRALKDAWICAVEKYSSAYFLNDKEVSVLKDFSHSLGDSDISGQTSNILLHIEMLKQIRNDAEIKLKEKSRIALSIGAFSGLVLAIILV